MEGDSDFQGVGMTFVVVIKIKIEGTFNLGDAFRMSGSLIFWLRWWFLKIVVVFMVEIVLFLIATPRKIPSRSIFRLFDPLIKIHAPLLITTKPLQTPKIGRTSSYFAHFHLFSHLTELPLFNTYHRKNARSSQFTHPSKSLTHTKPHPISRSFVV